MVYLYFYIYTFSHHNYFWLFSQSSFSLFLVASNGCSAACSNVCSTAGLLVEHQTFYIDEKLLFSSCSWNTDGSTRRVFFLCFRFLGLLTELVQGWLWQSCKLCPGARFFPKVAAAFQQWVKAEEICCLSEESPAETSFCSSLCEGEKGICLSRLRYQHRKLAYWLLLCSSHEPLTDIIWLYLPFWSTAL